jgi:hypothetical protein
MLVLVLFFTICYIIWLRIKFFAAKAMLDATIAQSADFAKRIIEMDDAAEKSTDPLVLKAREWYSASEKDATLRRKYGNNYRQ